MIAKKKLLKLKQDLERLGVTQDEIADLKICSKQYLHKIYRAEKYDEGVVGKLVELRDERKEKAKTIEAAI